MKVKLLTSIASDEASHASGEIVDLDAAYAARLIESGQAEAAGGAPKTKAKAKKKPGPSKTADKKPSEEA